MKRSFYLWNKYLKESQSTLCLYVSIIIAYRGNDRGLSQFHHIVVESMFELQLTFQLIRNVIYSRVSFQNIEFFLILFYFVAQENGNSQNFIPFPPVRDGGNFSPRTTVAVSYLRRPVRRKL